MSPILPAFNRGFKKYIGLFNTWGRWERKLANTAAFLVFYSCQINIGSFSLDTVMHIRIWPVQLRNRKLSLLKACKWHAILIVRQSPMLSRCEGVNNLLKERKHVKKFLMNRKMSFFLCGSEFVRESGYSKSLSFFS